MYRAMKEAEKTQTSSPAPEAVGESRPIYKSESFWVILVLLSILTVGSLLAYQGYKAVAGLVASESTDTASSYKTKFVNDIPSSCGYTIGWPTTVDKNAKGETQQWTYEEVPVNEEAFRGLVPASVTKQGVLMGTMLFKTQGEKFNKNPNSSEDFVFGQPGFISFCTNNSSKWSLDDFIAYVKKNSNDDLSYRLSGEKEMWGEVEVQPIRVKGIFAGDFVDEPFYLSVIPEDSSYSRLVIFQPWGSKDDRIETDRLTIYTTMKERDVTSALSFTSSSSSAPSSGSSAPVANCTQYKIYEGEFASDKCYSSGDLNDLKYYISRYNSAVFEQNSNASSMKITCNGSEFFKNQCEEDKKEYDQAIKDKETYKTTIQGIIAKGK